MGSTTTDVSACVNCFTKVNACPVGQYFTKRSDGEPCICADCRLQPINCTSKGMMYFGCDGYGIEDNSNCTSDTIDFGRQCVDGLEYESISCRPTRGSYRQCATCSNVEVEKAAIDAHIKFIESPCTVFKDAVVTSCSTGKKCDPGETWQNCSTYSNGMCVPCSSIVCPKGKFLSQCTTQKDAECVPCNSSLVCSAAAAGEEVYRSECKLSNDHECKNCTRCVEGKSYEVQPCTNETDRECALCTNMGACPVDTYKRAGCTLKHNTDCYPCSRHPCPDGYYESAPCNATSDRVCSRCSDACPRGQFISSQCFGKLDIGCSDCSSPSCASDETVVPCGLNTDAVCKKCSFPSGCEEGKTYEKTQCTQYTDRECAPCTRCEGNNYEREKCTKTQNTVCWYCGLEALLLSNLDTKNVSTSWYSLRANESQAWNNYTKKMEPNPFWCTPFSGGTCGESSYESKRCSYPWTQNPADAKDKADVCMASPPKWLKHPDLMHECKSCKKQCNPPDALVEPEYESVPCTGSAWNVPGTDRNCSRCRPSCPKEGDSIVQRCSARRDTVCLSEVVCTCGPGFFRQQDCVTANNVAMNATCLPVTRSCPSGFYAERDATETSNTVCSICPTTCPAGQYQQWPARNSSRMAACPFSCEVCTTCGFKQFLPRERMCSALNNSVCEACRNCSDGLYKIGECNGLQGTQCWPCSEPPRGTYLPVEGRCSSERDTVPASCK